MKLSERLEAVQTAEAEEHEDDLDLSIEASPIEARPANPMADLIDRARQQLLVSMGGRINDAGSSDEDLRRLVVTELTSIVDAEPVPLSPEERKQVINTIVASVLGYGPIQPLLADPSVTEVMVNGPNQIFVERAGRLTLADTRFEDDAQLRRVINRIVSPIGRRIDESSPMVDARLPDGSRVNAIIPPLAVDGASLTIRKFSKKNFSAEDLVKMNSATVESIYLIAAAVRGRLNTLVSGGTGSGKTSLLNVLSSFIPEGERIVTIEDAVELRMGQEHVVRLEARPGNSEGRGLIEIRDLVRNALRMRPDRVIVGECRGGEALDMLQAMNTGHAGSLSTLHANSPDDATSRLETMVLMGGIDLPIPAIRKQIESAVDLIVHTSRLRDGSRRIVEVSECDGMEGVDILVKPIFKFRQTGIDADGRLEGQLEPTGHRPAFVDHLRDAGLSIDDRLFEPRKSVEVAI